MNENLTFTITIDGTKVDLTPDMCVQIYHTYERAMHEHNNIEGRVTIMQLFERSLDRCYAYEANGQMIELHHEIGMLRGISLALNAIGIWPNGEKFLHFLNAGQLFTDNDSPLPS